MMISENTELFFFVLLGSTALFFGFYIVFVAVFISAVGNYYDAVNPKKKTLAQFLSLISPLILIIGHFINKRKLRTPAAVNISENTVMSDGRKRTVKKAYKASIVLFAVSMVFYVIVLVSGLIFAFAPSGDGELNYDRYGNSYSYSTDVPLYDKNGEVYSFELSPLNEQNAKVTSYYVSSDGEIRLDAMNCYVDEQGYLYFDREGCESEGENSSLTFNEESGKYVDKEGNVYLFALSAAWDENGSLTDEYTSLPQNE